MVNPKRARSWKRRKQPRGGTYARTRQLGGQGVYREVESEGLEEKYRAVVDGGDPEDKPVGQRWDLVEPALWGRRHSHPPTAPRCLRTARYGRFVRDPGRARMVPGWHRGNEHHKVDAVLSAFFHYIFNGLDPVLAVAKSRIRLLIDEIPPAYPYKSFPVLVF